MTIANWIGMAMLAAFVLNTAASFYWAGTIKPVSHARGFTGFSCHYKALNWARKNMDGLTATEQVAAQRALQGYRCNLYCVVTIIALAVITIAI